MSSEFDEKNE